MGRPTTVSRCTRRTTGAWVQRRARLLVAISLVTEGALLGALAVSAGAQEPGPIAWADPSGVLVIPPVEGSSIEATVDNQTGEPVDIAVDEASSSLNVTPATATIEAGGSASLSIAWKDEVETPELVTLVVVAAATDSFPDGFVLRRVVQSVESISPAASSVDVRSTWGGLGGTYGATVPTSPQVRCEDFEEPDDPIGYVGANGQEPVAVTLTCTSADGHDDLQLEFADLPRTGATFKGTVTILGEDVSITLQRSTTPLLPVVLLAIGLLAGLWIMARTPGRIIEGLEKRLQHAESELGTGDKAGPALTAFRQAAGVAEWRDLDFLDSFNAEVASVRAALAQLQRDRRFTLTDGDTQVTALSSRINALENLVKTLPTLAASLTRLGKTLPMVEASRVLPAWSAWVRSEFLARQNALSVADFAAFASGASAAEKLADWWPSVLQQIRAIDDRLRDLKSSGPRPADEDRITAAVGALNVALGAFSRAADTAAVRIAYQTEFERAMRRTDDLKDLQVTRSAGYAGPDALEPLSAILSQLTPSSASSAAAGEGLAQERVLGWVAVVIVAGLLLLGGLQALYVDKVFGSAWNLLSALAWGAASGAVALPLAAAIENFARAGNRAN